MTGRDPHEEHRVATPLELLFDLCFVIAFSAAANELAHAVAAGHVATGIGGFAFAAFGTFWAWLQWTWFASAYDTDDWIYRLLTLAQMVGVLVFTLGLPAMFASMDQGGHLDNRVMVLGYVVMRVPMVLQWLRAAAQDPARRRQHNYYVVTIVLSQIVWCALAVVDLSLRTTLLLMIVPMALELAGPVAAETKAHGTMTPWHPHHIAERYGLLVIIALGEGLLGTTTSLAAVVGPQGPGWSWDVAGLGVSGVAMAFGMWWLYFGIRFGDFLHAHRDRGFGFGYGHYVVLAALVAVGAGLHVAAYFYQRESTLGGLGTVAALAIPLTIFIVGIYALFSLVTRSIDPYHAGVLAGTILVIVAALALAAAGASLVISLLVLTLAPWISVVAYERHGHDFQQQVLDRD